ncbi:hypothetical protein F4782DRAFT_196075 [Xylaria castorea]|nr:hypothetical protein F4782DRAFT_196075 [Xylaria castorea]
MEDFIDEIRLWSSNFEARVLGIRAESTPPPPDTIHDSGDRSYQSQYENDIARDSEDDQSDTSGSQGYLECATRNKALIGRNSSLNDEDESSEEIDTLRSPELSPNSHGNDTTGDDEGADSESHYQSSSVGKEEDTDSEGDDQSSLLSSSNGEPSQDLEKDGFSPFEGLQGLVSKLIP